MGYYTKYTITFSGYNTGETEKYNNFILKSKEMGLVVPDTVAFRGEPEVNKIKNELREFGLHRNGNGVESEDVVKWYGWETDMKDFSRKYPHVLFEINGEGEENNDIWRAFIKNGKSQIIKAVLTFEEYDETKLK